MPADLERLAYSAGFNNGLQRWNQPQHAFDLPLLRPLRDAFAAIGDLLSPDGVRFLLVHDGQGIIRGLYVIVDKLALATSCTCVVINRRTTPLDICEHVTETLPLLSTINL